MGLGEIPKDSMLKKLQVRVGQMAAADSSLPVIPALHHMWQ